MINSIQRQFQSLIVILACFFSVIILSLYAPENKISDKAMETIVTVTVGYVVYKQGRELRASDQEKNGKINEKTNGDNLL